MNIAHQLRLIGLITILFIAAPSNTFAQEGNDPSEAEMKRAAKKFKLLRTWSIGLKGQMFSPLTDLRFDGWPGSGETISENSFGAGLSITKMLNHSMGIQLSGNFAPKLRGAVNPESLVTTIIGTDTVMSYNNTWIDDEVYFETGLMNGSINLYWNITNTNFGINRLYRGLQGYKKPRKWSLIAFAGVGFTQYESSLLTVSGDNEYVSPDVDLYSTKHAESQTALTIPVGLGIKYQASPFLDIGIEGSLQNMMADDLDLLQGSSNGGYSNDRFSTLGLTLTLKPGAKDRSEDHYEWVNEVELMGDNFARQETLLGRIRKDLAKFGKDGDNDGVPDFFDREPLTPDGLRVDANGTALDSDLDGIPDDWDEQPFSPSGAEVDTTGVALDSDDDGVADIFDRQKNTPKKAQVDVRGVEIKIPEVKTAAPVITKPVVTAPKVTFPPLFFAINSSTINSNYEGDLFAIANHLRQNPSARIASIGNADQKGKNDYNLKLGQRRAAAVARYLVKNYGIDASRISIETRGEETLISKSNDNLNRRVDIELR